MSDLDNLLNDQDDDSQLVKDLRAQIRKLSGEKKALEAENSEFKATQRSSSVAEILKSKGINTKVAKLIPADVEANEESVTKWLEEWGDVFGVAQKDESTDPDPTPGTQAADLAAVAQFAKAQEASHAGEPAVTADAEAFLKNLQEAGDKGGLDAIFEAAGVRI